MTATPAHSALSRRKLLSAAALLVPLGLGGAAWAQQPAELPPIEVWKSPDCSCCKDWVAHVQKSGFKVLVHDVADTTPVRERLGMPAEYAGCHTALVAGYVIEGHVPAEEIKRLLASKRSALGLSVPGMPMGTPGMDGPNEVAQPFAVMLILKSGVSTVYAEYPKD